VIPDLLVTDAFSSVNRYVSEQLGRVVLHSMVRSAYRLDYAGKSEEWDTFRGCCDDYKNTLDELMVQSIGRYSEIATSDASLGLYPDPCKLIKAAVVRNIIRPGSRLMWAWMFWVLYGGMSRVPGVPILPLDEPEKLVGTMFPLPEWMPGHAGTVQRINDEAQHVRAVLRADLDEELKRADMSIRIARLRGTARLKDRGAVERKKPGRPRTSDTQIQRMRELYEELKNWGEVSKRFPGMTGNACRKAVARYKTQDQIGQN
jgi:hypothetical protein